MRHLRSEITTRVALSATLLTLLGLVAGTAPSDATTGNTAVCTFELYGKYKPGLPDPVIPVATGADASGTATCSGQAHGRDLPKEPGIMTSWVRRGKAPLNPAYGDSCAFGNAASRVEIVWGSAAGRQLTPSSAPSRSDRRAQTRRNRRHRSRRGRRRRHRNSIRTSASVALAPAAAGNDAGVRLSGEVSWLYSSEGVAFGQLDGEQFVAQYGWGGDPDAHYGTCTKSDPIEGFAIAGRFLLSDAQTTQGVAQQHAITAFQYVPSGSVNANPFGLTAPFLASYPVTQGDSITFTNLDTHPHTVTACAAPCTTFPDQTASGAFDGDVHLAGDTYTIDTGRLKPGTYQYYCQFHPFMRGSFIVQPKPSA